MNPVKQLDRRMGIALVLSGLFLLLFCAYILIDAYGLPVQSPTRTPAPPTSTPDPATPILASMMCKQFVLEQLKAPSTAKFQNVFDAQSSEISPDLFVVVSYVDSENSFGAMLRTAYQCKIKYIGNETWELVELLTEP